MDTQAKDMVAVMEKTKELLNKGWNKRALARRVNGDGTDMMDPDAVSWCIIGGIHKACLDLRLG